MRWCFFALLAACVSASTTGDTEGPAGGPDTSGADTGSATDTSNPADTASEDSDPTDVDTSADSDRPDTDLIDDSGVSDSDVAEPGVDPWPDTGAEGCDFIDTKAFVADCGDRWTTVYEMASYPSDSSCETWYRREGLGYATMGAALVGCETSCVYVPTIAAMVLYCGYRGEFTEFTDGGPGQTAAVGSCGSLIYAETYAGSGWASSWEEFISTHSCPPSRE